MKRSLRSWLWRVDVDSEVDDELAFHIEMRTRELVEKGVDPRIAREMVLARIGDASRLKRTCVDLGRKRDREMRLTQWLDERRQDVRFALRQLKSTPYLYRRRGDHTRARHRGEQRHLRTRRRDTDSSASVPGQRIAWSWSGQRASTFPDAAYRQHPSRLGRADSSPRRAGSCQHGDRRRSACRSARRLAPERRPTVRDRRVSSTRSA